MKSLTYPDFERRLLVAVADRCKAEGPVVVIDTFEVAESIIPNDNPHFFDFVGAAREKFCEQNYFHWSGNGKIIGLMTNGIVAADSARSDLSTKTFKSRFETFIAKNWIALSALLVSIIALLKPSH